MQLLICNFIIAHKLEKTNSINLLSRQFNYKVENIFANCLLFTLQQKLIRIKSLNSFIFIAIRKIYCTYMKNEIEKMSVHNVSENASKYLVIHVRSILLREIYYTCVINEVKKMSVHNISENIKKCLAMHVRSMLLKAMIIVVQKMHLNKIYFLRNKISQFKLKNLRCQNIDS